MAATKKTYQDIHDVFATAVTAQDCGRKCAHHNGGSPVCCSTSDAVPIAQQVEWKLLKSAGDLWRPYRARDQAGQDIIETLDDSCIAIECKGAQHCVREQRSLSCRAFPFFPYITREKEFIGMSYYWTFEGRCWVIENLSLVEKKFLSECAAAYEILFRDDPGEFDVYRQYSATMRRVFSRWGRDIPVLALDGTHQKILPYGGGVVMA